MLNNTCWRQPTPTDIRDCDSIDILSRMLFLDILNGCQNEKYNKIYYHGNKRIDLELNRGQYLFVVSRYAKAIHVSNKIIQKSLKIIQKWYNEMHIEKKGYGLIITIKNYDELVTMHNEKDNESTTKEKRKKNESKSNNKTVKSVKTDKTDIDIIHEEKNKKIINLKEIQEDQNLKEIINYYNQIFNKQITSNIAFIENYNFWKKIHSLEKIKLAIRNAKLDQFWKDKLTLVILFRRKNPNREAVDYIENLANLSNKPTTLTEVPKFEITEEQRLQNKKTLDLMKFKILNKVF